MIPIGTEAIVRHRGDDQGADDRVVGPAAGADHVAGRLGEERAVEARDAAADHGLDQGDERRRSRSRRRW